MRYLNIILYILVGCFLPASVFAQSAQQIEIQEQALRQLNDVQTQRLESEGADRYRSIKGGPVTLAQVMRHPDDINLNFRYAQTQVADGDLRGASATLERILLINPRLVNIRLFYAYVLYRLDNNTGLEEQLKLLHGAHLSASDQQEVINLQKRASRRQRATVFSANLAAGFAYQSDANYAPDSGFNDVIVATPLGPFIGQVPVPTPAQDDMAAIGSANISVRHDLGYQAGHYLFGSVGTYWNEQADVGTSDYNTIMGNAGLRYFAPWADITAQFLGGNFRLNGHNFMNYYAFDINLQRDFLAGALRLNLRQRTTYEDYVVSSTDSQERTGPRYAFELGGQYRLAPNQQVGGALIYTDKNAKKSWREFDGLDFRINHTWIISRGIYIQNALDYYYENYNTPDPRVSLKTRKDNNFSYQITFSSPLNRLFRNINLPRSIGDIRLNAALSYTVANSNIQNYKYDNLRFEILFNKHFDF